MKTILYFILLGLGLFITRNASGIDESIVWKFQTGDKIYATPIFSDTVLFIGSLDSNFYAINRNTGGIIWSFPTLNEIRTTAVLHDSILCFAAGQYLYALNLSGELLWDFQLCSGTFVNSHDDWDDFNSSPILDGNSVYIGTEQGLIFGVDILTGDTTFNFQTEGAYHTIESTPVISNGKIFFGDWNGVFYCVDIASESLEWSYDTKDDNTYSWVNAIQNTPVIYNDQVLFAGRSCNLYSVNVNTGDKTWMFHDGASMWILGGLVLEDTVVYAGSSNQFVLQAFDVRTGERLWTTPVDYRIYGSPFMAEEYYIVGTGLEASTPDGSLYLINRNDHIIRERIIVGGQVHSSPVMVDSIIYFGCSDGNLYAVSLESMLNKARPHSYIEDPTPVDCGTLINNEVYNAEVTIINDGMAADSIVVTCQNSNVIIEPPVFILESDMEKAVDITFNLPAMEPQFYSLNIVFKSHRSLFQDRFVKKYNIDLITEVNIDQEQNFSFSLHQNFPNPFNENTSVLINLKKPGYASLIIYDAIGNRIAVIFDGYMDEGMHTLNFDGSDLYAGLYNCQLITEEGSETIVMNRINQ